MNLVLANWAQTQPPGRPKSAGEGRGAHQGEQGRHQPRGQAQDRQQGKPHRDHLDLQGRYWHGYGAEEDGGTDTGVDSEAETEGAMAAKYIR